LPLQFDSQVRLYLVVAESNFVVDLGGVLIVVREHR
jgi:hypothetical protein